MAFQDPGTQQYYPSPTGPTYSSTGTDRATFEPLPSARTDTLPRADLRPPDAAHFSENKSYGEAAAGLGNLISSVTKATDTVIKDQFTKDLYTGIDNIRREFGVDEATNLAGMGMAGDVSAANAREKWFQDNTVSGEAPVAVRKLGAKVQGLFDAYEAGKYTDSYYAGKLEAFVRTVREQHPGYREDIDATVEKITGITPANKIRSALQQDVKELYQKQQQKVSEYQKFLVTNAGYLPPNWQSMQPQEVMGRVIDNKGFEHRQDEARKPLLTTQGEGPDGRPLTPEQRKQTAIQSYTAIANEEVNRFLVNGVPGMLTPQQIQNMILEQKKPGAKPWTPEQTQQMVGALDYYEKTAEMSVRQQGLKPHMPGKPFSLATDIADDGKFQEVVNGSLRPIKMMKEAILDQKAGIMGAASAIIQGKTEAKHRQILDGPDGDAMATVEVAKKMMGDTGLNTWLSFPDSQGKTPISTIGRALNAVSLSKSVTSPNGTAPLADHFAERAKSKVGVSGAELNSTLNMHLGALTNPEVIKTIPPEQRATVALNTFTNLEKLVEDGMIKPGQYKSFVDKTVSPAVTKGITDLKETNPQLFERYKDYALRVVKATYFDAFNEVTNVAKNKNYILSANNDGTINVRFDPNKFPDAAEPLEASRRIQEANRGLRLLGPVMKEAGIKPEDLHNALGIDTHPIDNFKDHPAFGTDEERTTKSKENIEKQRRLLRGNSSLDFGAPVQPMYASPQATATQDQTDVRPKGTVNLTDRYHDIGTIKVDDIPEGMSARDFLKFLKEQQSRP